MKSTTIIGRKAIGVFLVAVVLALPLQESPVLAKPVGILPDEELYDRWAEYMEKTMPTWEYHIDKWGEELGWHAAPALRGLVGGYEYSGEERWLDYFTAQADELFARLKDEEGYPGWGHSIVGEALLLEPVLHFIYLAQTDGRMPESYRKKAEEYLRIVDPALLTKWEKMGRWKETHLECGTFVFVDGEKTLPHNMNAHAGITLLWAAKVTPSAERRADYLDKAAKLARRWHKFLKVKDGDRYIWHYWDAAGRWDYGEKGKSRHWTSLEHRGYASADTAFVALAYDFGLVFDRKDIEMHCNTFLKEIWNGDDENPEYKPLGWFNPDYATSVIYTGLARFHPKILELFGRKMSENPASWGAISGVPHYLLTKKRGVGFDQQFAEFTASSLTKEQMGKLGVATGR